MHEKWFQKRRVSALVMLVLLGWVWMGCSTVKERPEDTTVGKETADGKYYFFDDVLIPKELNYKPGKSSLYETPKYKAGWLVFSKWRADVEPLIGFFTHHMEKDNWKLVNIFRGREFILNFSKPEKTCTIKIVKTWTGHVELEVRVGPLA